MKFTLTFMKDLGVCMQSINILPSSYSCTCMLACEPVITGVMEFLSNYFRCFITDE